MKVFYFYIKFVIRNEKDLETAAYFYWFEVIKEIPAKLSEGSIREIFCELVKCVSLLQILKKREINAEVDEKEKTGQWEKEMKAWLGEQSSIRKEQGKSRPCYCAVPTRPGPYRPTPTRLESELALFHDLVLHRKKTRPLIR